MNLQLEAMALTMPKVAGHPNRLPFRALLTLAGVASQRAPHGAQGHRVMLTRSAADAALPSLLGMALDYAPSLDSHDVRRKIGIITEATIVPLHPTLSPGAPPLLPAVGNRVGPGKVTGQLAVSGYLFAKDFPDVVDEIRAQSSAADSTLGMSYEVTSVDIPHRSSSIWTVTAFTFTGAAVLRRDKAAYPQTWIALETGAGGGPDKA